jgi:cytochrome c556
MKRITTFTLAAVLSTTCAGGIALADGHAEKAMAAAIEARKHQMQLNGYSMGILGAMAKGDVAFDAATATAAASNLAATAKLDRSILWLDGTIQGEVPNTRAKAEIWSDAAGFEKSATDLETAADALVAAAGTDLAALQEAMKAAGASCGACHEKYRGPRN